MMHKANCAECGSPCEVPFKPTGDKPVYCDKCFGKDDGDFKPKRTDESKQMMELLNTKLDRIIKALEAAGFKKPDAVVKPAETKKEVKKEEVKVAPSKKPSLGGLNQKGSSVKIGDGHAAVIGDETCQIHYPKS